MAMMMKQKNHMTLGKTSNTPGTKMRTQHIPQATNETRERTFQRKNREHCSRFFLCGACARTRTCSPYLPGADSVGTPLIISVRVPGLEPGTSPLSVGCSSHLSYTRVQGNITKKHLFIKEKVCGTIRPCKIEKQFFSSAF